MLGGALQALATADRGVHDIDPGFSDWVARRFAELNDA
jgi:hypothetical protein